MASTLGNINIAYPFRFDAIGRVATTPPPAHLEQLIAQVLFTNPGDRVNRPDFGSGLARLVFDPLSDELLSAVEVTVKASLVRWLNDILQIIEVDLTAEQSQLRIAVSYKANDDDFVTRSTYTVGS